LSGKLKRKFLAARQDFVAQLHEMASRKNMTLYALVNETLEQLFRAEEMEVPLPEVVDGYSFMKLVRESGFMVVHESLLFYLLEKVLEENDSLADMFYKNGYWFGKYLQVRFSGQEPLGVFKKIASRFFGGVSEFRIIKNSDEVSLQCIGFRLLDSYTKLLSVFFEGVIDALGYSIIKRDVSKGIISLTFKTREGVE